MIRPAIAALLISVFAGNVYAETRPPADEYAGNPDCLVFNASPVPNESVIWSGGCKDGYAEGVGYAQWSVNGKDTGRYEGMMVRGKRHGRGATQFNDVVYSGEFRDNKRHGPGILAKEGAYTLTGNFIDGLPAGVVKVRFQSGNSYEGQWRNEAPDGEGTMQYATGGNYRGGWKDGVMHGHGVITYANGMVREGDFAEGIIAGGSPLPEGKETYRLRKKVTEDGFPGSAGISDAAPFDKGYDALTAEQQRRVRAVFPLLQDGDRPPYPVLGVAPLIRAIHQLHIELETSGDLWLDVLIDENGAPQTVAVRKTPHRELAEFLGKGLLLTKFTPAQCGGKPCAMRYPFRLKLVRGN